ncbi:MAG: PTS sugar transporter subunit IIA [Acidobacteriota bacterium]
MVGILILTHGQMADELLASARKILCSDLQGFNSLTLDWDETFEGASKLVEEALEPLEQGSGVLILTDIYGGTPTNVALEFLQAGRVEVISGVNLPMVVRLGCLFSSQSTLPLPELSTWIEGKGKASICSGRSSKKPPRKLGC